MKDAARDLANAVRGGDVRAVAKAVTLVESGHERHRSRAERLLRELLPDGEGALRVAVSGVPGVGKSTFIEALGNRLLDSGETVAVLSVDPSSALSGGSILADKTRMETLARREGVYVRPSPAAGNAGGVARGTRDSILVLEAAGFDVVIVETVGVGQSEMLAAELTDVFLLLLLPGGGDELQGIKRGVVELADVVAVNKSDGEFAAAARRAVDEYARAVALLRARARGWSVPVLSCSARDGTGVAEVWETVRAFIELRRRNGDFVARRAEQRGRWFRREVDRRLLELVERDPALRRRREALEEDVVNRRLTAAAAARSLILEFMSSGVSIP